MYLGNIDVTAWTAPYVPSSYGSDGGEWWEEPLGNVAGAASQWLSGKIAPSVGPYGPGMPGGYVATLEPPPSISPPPVTITPARAVGVGTGAALALGGLAFLMLRSR